MNQLQSGPHPHPRASNLTKPKSRGAKEATSSCHYTLTEKTPQMPLPPGADRHSIELWRQNVSAWRREPMTQIPQTKDHSPHPGCVSTCNSTTNAGQSHPLHGPSNSSYLFLGGFGARTQKHLPLSCDHLPAPTSFTVTHESSLCGPCAINTLTAPLAPSTAPSGCREVW